MGGCCSYLSSLFKRTQYSPIPENENPHKDSDNPVKNDPQPKVKVSEAKIPTLPLVPVETKNITLQLRLPTVFTSKFATKERLGEGATSVCHRCVEFRTKTNYAAKIVDKGSIGSAYSGKLQQVYAEIQTLRILNNHPNIVKLHQVYDDGVTLVMVTELLKGGQFFDYIVGKDEFSEAEAVYLVRQIVSAVDFMHKSHIVHRDLKPENIMLLDPVTSSNSSDSLSVRLKVIDFGFAKDLSRSSDDGATDDTQSMLAHTYLGSRGYIAPELEQTRNSNEDFAYGKSVDMWAIGVIVFNILCGCMPFSYDPSKVDRDSFSLRFPSWTEAVLSSSSKDFLRRLLESDPSRRMSATEALNHPWLALPNKASQTSSTTTSSYLQSPMIMRRNRPDQRGVGNSSK